MSNNAPGGGRGWLGKVVSKRPPPEEPLRNSGIVIL
jgi:hypothetical protein